MGKIEEITVNKLKTPALHSTFVNFSQKIVSEGKKFLLSRKLFKKVTYKYFFFLVSDNTTHTGTHREFVRNPSMC